MPEHQHEHDRHAQDDGHAYEIWDVFTDTPLEGNPLGVFPRAEELPSRLHQRLARELNLSETVYILPDDPATADAQIRIYTPLAELPFAGHPTLGAAYAVSSRHGYARVRLRTGAGVVEVTMTRDEHGHIVQGEIRQPVPTVEDHPDPAGLLAALGLERSELPVELYFNGSGHVVVTVADRATLTALTPDLYALIALGAHGVAVITLPHPRADSPAGGGAAHIFSRNFCPALGVPEDPATGSAAGPVAVHLMRHGLVPAGTTIEIGQGVEMGRPSKLLATAWGSATQIEAVTVAGSAVRVAVGNYRLG